MATSIGERIYDLLLPSTIEETRRLVAMSGLRRLQELTDLTVYLGAQEGLQARRELFLQSLEEDEAADSRVLFRRLSSPLFRGWLTRFSAVQTFTEADSTLMDQLRFWNNMRYSFLESRSLDAEFGCMGGVCACWDPRLCIAVGNRPSVRVRRDEGTLLVTDVVSGAMILEAGVGPSGELRRLGGELDCHLMPTLALPGSDVALRNDIPQLHLQLSDTLQRDTGVVFGALDHSQESYPPFAPAEFVRAAEILRESWTEEYADFGQTLLAVVPRDVSAEWKRRGWRGRGMTVSSHQGAVWILARGQRPVYEHMVHEQSHVKLRYIEESYPILQDGQTDDRYQVPWRPDPRPIVGIYEAVYVHLHMMIALQRAHVRNEWLGESEEQGRSHVAEIGVEVSQGIEILAKHAKFTEEGEAFIDWSKDTLDRVTHQR